MIIKEVFFNEERQEMTRDVLDDYSEYAVGITCPTNNNYFLQRIEKYVLGYYYHWRPISQKDKYLTIKPKSLSKRK